MSELTHASQTDLLGGTGDPPPPVRVIVVDDDPDDLWLLRRALTRAAVGALALDLRICRGAAVALEWLRGLDRANGLNAPGSGPPPIPDLMLIDMNMPGMSGIELVRIIRQRPEFRNTRLFMITTAAETHLSEEARAAGADAVIPKPDTLAGLDALARGVVQRQPDPRTPPGYLQMSA